MKSLKALRIAVENSVSKARTCTVESCTFITREGKDYCPTHVGLHPYVRSLVQRIEDRVKEDELVRRKGSSVVNLEGITVSEILLCLRHGGTRTEERLTRDTQLDKTIIHNYLIRLSMEGLIRFGRTSRNNISVCLVNHDPAMEIEED
jgi:hypothetical protein